MLRVGFRRGLRSTTAFVSERNVADWGALGRCGSFSSPWIKADVRNFDSRLFSTEASASGTADPGREDIKGDPFVYTAPFGKALRRVKMLSLTSCGFAVAACPVICLLPNTIDSLAGKIGLCASLSIFGIFTTGLLHWFSSPYVHQLKFDGAAARKEIDVKTLTLFARQRWERLALDSIKPADTWRPLATFESQGKLYYIHVDQFNHRKLLKRLVPPAEETPGS
ncbi:hypothetical protein BSKO_05048 [Bryopsis sp. KO-2023]|nr:hypothetical protein BSKO_05048 [Bryopsis sp. KO-2023]